MDYTKAISPVSNSYLTKGAEYPIIWIDEYEYDEYGLYFKIKNDKGRSITTSQNKCPHIKGLSWQLK